MLKNRYQEILVGLNLMSLVRGLISLRRNRSTLLIDDNRFQAESYPESFISELEILSFLRLGTKYDIPELVNIRQFILPARVQYVASSVRMSVGGTPFENLIELLRKYPELIDSADLDLVYSEGEKGFDDLFFQELFRYESLLFESKSRPKVPRFELSGPGWFRTVYQRFGELLNREYSLSKELKYSGLLHLLGVAFEDKLKSILAPEEIPFYFFRLISPIYRLQDFFLMAQLKRRLLLLGGDYKDSRIQFWQFHEGKFENLLLESFEGVISGKRVLFFSHLPDEVPFSISSPLPFYRKARLGPLRRGGTPFPPTELIFLADLNLLGAERAYRAIGLGEEVVFYDMPYLEMPGSKSEFYERLLFDSFKEDVRDIPLEKVEFRPVANLSASLDLRQLRNVRKSEGPVLSVLPFKITEGTQVISGFEYWGNFKYRSLGQLALCYGIEEN